MDKYLEFSSQDGPILVRVAESPGDVVAVSRAEDLVEKTATSMRQAFAMAAGVAHDFHDAIKKSPVDSATVEFGVQFTGKGRLYIVESEAQCAFKVTLNVTPRRGEQ
ncbi:CU044_2847 family protein [Mycobacteroides chelonae]